MLSPEECDKIAEYLYPKIFDFAKEMTFDVSKEFNLGARDSVAVTIAACETYAEIATKNMSNFEFKS